MLAPYDPYSGDSNREIFKGVQHLKLNMENYFGYTYNRVSYIKGGSLTRLIAPYGLNLVTAPQANSWLT